MLLCLLTWYNTIIVPNTKNILNYLKYLLKNLQISSHVSILCSLQL